MTKKPVKSKKRFPGGMVAGTDGVPRYQRGTGEKTLEMAYKQQLDEIGQILVRSGVLTRAAIRRDGVRFAVRDHFEPRKVRIRRGASRRALL